MQVVKESNFDKIPETIQEAMKWGTDYHHLKQGIIHHFKGTTIHYLICGCLLTEAHTKKIWEKDGSMAESFSVWCEKEMCFKRSQVQRMMQIWAALKPIIEKHLQLILEVDYSKLALMAPYLINLSEAEQEEMLHSGKHLSVKALENNLREKDGKTATDNCDHVNTEPWVKCCKCHKFFKE